MKNLALKIAMLVIISTSLTGCIKNDKLKNAFWKPASLDLTPPPGPQIYQQGWSDGCETGMSAYQNNFAKLMKAYKYKQDPVLRNNRMYFQAWKDAYVYCAAYLASINSGTI